MQLELFLENSDAVVVRALEMLRNKNFDYSKDEDAFSAFKCAHRLKEAIGMSCPAWHGEKALDEILKKVGRLVNIGFKDPNYDSVEDSVLDIICFALLYHGMYMEQMEGKKK